MAKKKTTAKTKTKARAKAKKPLGDMDYVGIVVRKLYAGEVLCHNHVRHFAARHKRLSRVVREEAAVRI